MVGNLCAFANPQGQRQRRQLGFIDLGKFSTNRFELLVQLRQFSLQLGDGLGFAGCWSFTLTGFGVGGLLILIRFLFLTILLFTRILTRQRLALFQRG